MNRQMVEKPVILCTHCDTSAMSFGSVNKFHEHFKEHGMLTAYGCHRCLHLFHTREMWEQHRKETCKENSTDDVSPYRNKQSLFTSAIVSFSLRDCLCRMRLHVRLQSSSLYWGRLRETTGRSDAYPELSLLGRDGHVPSCHHRKRRRPTLFRGSC